MGRVTLGSRCENEGKRKKSITYLDTARLAILTSPAWLALQNVSQMHNIFGILAMEQYSRNRPFCSKRGLVCECVESDYRKSFEIRELHCLRRPLCKNSNSLTIRKGPFISLKLDLRRLIRCRRGIKTTQPSRCELLIHLPMNSSLPFFSL
jgi:hypothetical protein